MDHQTDVWLVDTHPKGISRRDDAQISDAKILLDLTFVISTQARVISLGRDAPLFQELRHTLGGASGRTIDDRPRDTLTWEVGLDRVEDICHLGYSLRWQHLKAQVRPRCTAVYQR